MFFSWYARNRHFKPRSDLSGQIFPFLLICLAGLLVAVILTIGVGEGAKAKTRASNAADAGSLAAASCWAAAFNKLVDRNKAAPNAANDNFGQYMSPDDTYQYYKRMKYYYLEMCGHYRTLYQLAKGYLTVNASDNALYYSQEALKSAQLALDDIIISKKDCKIWDNQRNGANHNNKAAELALASAECLGAFYILTQYMQKITDFFKENQTQNFSEAKDFMDRAYHKSRRTGLYYAFSNSSTSAHLTNALGDEFNYWLATGKFYDPPSNTATYKWEAGKHLNGDPRYGGTTVTLDLPIISSYELKCTKWNYPQKKSLAVIAIPCLSIAASTITDDPFNIRASGTLTNNMLGISDRLTANKDLGMEIYNLTVKGKECCDSEYCNPDPYYHKARQKQQTLSQFQRCATTWLEQINSLSGEKLTIPMLGQLNILIWENVWAERPGVQSVRTLENVTTYLDDSDYPGMMVINIKSVTLDPPAWTTKCTVKIFWEDENGILQGPTSFSTSGFDGGDIGGAFEDTYYSRISGIS
ncbi:MAG: pilus assembly protein TadG-related protein [Candidatus Omnitrophica bacterium]|nr:pilus assembly protein TadG-related protein [Candidatus Omnitrophota bacterium]